VSDLDAKEQANVRTALRFLRARCGRWAAVAKALRFGRTTVANAAGGDIVASAALAVRVAKLAGVGVDDVLRGRFPPPGTCPHCGHCASVVQNQ
jgi:hypothetical protein